MGKLTVHSYRLKDLGWPYRRILFKSLKAPPRSKLSGLRLYISRLYASVQQRKVYNMRPSGRKLNEMRSVEIETEVTKH